MIILVILFLFSFNCMAQALRPFYDQNITPLSEFKEVHPEGVRENAIKLKNAEVLIADYGLIRRDFPAIAHLSDPEIDQWLIRQAGFMSPPQVAQASVNSTIPVVAETKAAYRPPEYGRALIFNALDENNKQIGIIDVKGAGGTRPSHYTHSSGVMTLGESLREFSYEKMITRVINHSGIDQAVVGSYAVIFPGFDVIHENGDRVPAGLYLRQAHRRATKAENKLSPEPRGNGWMRSNKRQAYDRLLTTYGIFANDNYQGTIRNDLFDFGHYIVREDMKRTRAELAVPFEQWGFDKAPDEEIFGKVEDERWKMSKRDRPWNWSHDVARAYVDRKIGRHEVWMHHYNLVNPVDQKLKRTPKIYDAAKNMGFNIRVCEQPFFLR